MRKRTVCLSCERMLQPTKQAISDAAASFFTEDAVRVGASGIVLRGKAEIEALYDKMLRHAPKEKVIRS